VLLLLLVLVLWVPMMGKMGGIERIDVAAAAAAAAGGGGGGGV
jgi:hypothetical protein